VYPQQLNSPLQEVQSIVYPQHVSTAAEQSAAGKGGRKGGKVSKHHKAHKTVSKPNNAATSIQAKFRGKKGRAEALAKKNGEVKEVVEEVQHGSTEELDAAAKIQASFRGKVTRREVVSKKQQLLDRKKARQAEKVQCIVYPQYSL
jgi:hypothetical protein